MTLLTPSGLQVGKRHPCRAQAHLNGSNFAANSGKAENEAT